MFSGSCRPESNEKWGETFGVTHLLGALCKTRTGEKLNCSFRAGLGYEGWLFGSCFFLCICINPFSEVLPPPHTERENKAKKALDAQIAVFSTSHIAHSVAVPSHSQSSKKQNLNCKSKTPNPQRCTEGSLIQARPQDTTCVQKPKGSSNP